MIVEKANREEEVSTSGQPKELFPQMFKTLDINNWNALNSLGGEVKISSGKKHWRIRAGFILLDN